MKKFGVLNSVELYKLFKVAKVKQFALAAINCIDTNTINSVFEAAKKYNTIVIIQFSLTGARFFSGNYLKIITNDIQSSIYGAILAAKYIHEISKYYEIPVILHTDHCMKEFLPWIDGLLEANKDFYTSYGHALFTSHMIDLSNYSLKENIDICSNYLSKLSKYNINLEIELGSTGGEEDGLDNSKLKKDKLYTQAVDVLYAYKKLLRISKYFTIAASFGNTHGVYQPGNVILSPKILYNSQKLVRQEILVTIDNPVSFVFHGGSGTSAKIIKQSISYGIVKINVDTDTQWAFWNGILGFYKKNKNYLQGQLGNPQGEYKPNKKFYDPRVWLNSAQESFIRCLYKIFNNFNCLNILKYFI